MNYLTSLFLGIVQGFTEFLPVSSSGHLVIAQHFLPGFSQPGVLFDIVLHLGTLLAVIIFFRKRLFTLGQKYYVLLVVGTLPAALVGVLFQDSLEKMFGNFRMVGVQLIITGFLNFLIDKARTTKDKITVVDSLVIGIAQAIAIIPGISRSGSTIFTGAKLGIAKEKIAEFSFLLSIPAILGASVLQLVSHGKDSLTHLDVYFVGFAAAFVSGLFSIQLVLKTLAQRKFSLFGLYCIALGLVVLFWV